MTLTLPDAPEATCGRGRPIDQQLRRSGQRRYTEDPIREAARRCTDLPAFLGRWIACSRRSRKPEMIAEVVEDEVEPNSNSCSLSLPSP